MHSTRGGKQCVRIWETQHEPVFSTSLDPDTVACSTLITVPRPPGCTSTRAVKTGFTLNPKKSKFPSSHTNTSSPLRVTVSPSNVLY